MHVRALSSTWHAIAHAPKAHTHTHHPKKWHAKTHVSHADTYRVPLHTCPKHLYAHMHVPALQARTSPVHMHRVLENISKRSAEMEQAKVLGKEPFTKNRRTESGILSTSSPHMLTLHEHILLLRVVSGAPSAYLFGLWCLQLHLSSFSYEIEASTQT